MSPRVASALPWTPRGLRREEAARYVGVSPSKFEQLVQQGRMPAPKAVDGCRIWDRVALDGAFDDLPDTGKTPQEPTANPWDDDEADA